MTTIRLPAVAGQFYPDNSQELQSQVEVFLAQATPSAGLKGSPRILIVPHAGYAYSGQTAAAGFKTLVGQSYRTVILLGASHRVAFAGAAIYPAGEWKTPLGKVRVDAALAQSLAAKDRSFVPNSQVHESEHSLEVELPFLQVVLKDFQILPILLGQIDDDTEKKLATALAAVMDESTLLVVSSDLSHYPARQVADKVDAETVAGILTGEVGKFDQAMQSSLSQGYPNLVTCACGESAIRIGMQVAQSLKLSGWHKLALTNSGEMTGESERVVGYASLVATSQVAKEPGQVGQLGEPAQKELLALARQTLISYLDRKGTPAVKVENPTLQEQYGAFVTLRTEEGELRGCIGTFEASQPLWQVAQKMAISAATQDPRFVPVTRQELDSLKIEISILSPRQRVSSAEEIILGKHGVWVERGGRSGVFLPQVATETGWSKEEFLSQLCSQKAGLSRDCWQESDTLMSIFEAQIIEEA
ncbi:MAG: AmmeMemoRadiSam system protein B [bacterium]|nr:AmmeMemoRadiSam system protein B [bacterium]